MKITLTYPTAAVLMAISHRHSYGFDIMDATGLPDGTVYPILRRLEKRGYLKASWESETAARSEGRPPRRYYRLTREGTEALAAAEARFPGLARLFGEPDARPETASP